MALEQGFSVELVEDVVIFSFFAIDGRDASDQPDKVVAQVLYATAGSEEIGKKIVLLQFRREWVETIGSCQILFQRSSVF